MKKKTIVLGLGNPLMTDEGIGIKVIDSLILASEQFPEADLVDAGTGGMALLHHIAGRKKAVIIDCALMGTKPGTIKRFTSDEVKTVKKLSHLSLHEADILKVIELSKQLGECPEQVVFFGIEPEFVGPGMSLSKTIVECLDEYSDAVRKELRS